MTNRDQQKSFAFHAGMFLENPLLVKTKYFVLFGLRAFVLLRFNTNPSRFIYAIYKNVSSEVVEWHKLLVFSFPQVHIPKILNVTFVKRNSLCWISPMTCVLIQNCIYVICRVFGGILCMCLSIKPRFAFLLLMTVEKVKRMQGNLTLVVSWNVGENQVMEWGAVAWKSFRCPLREVKFKVDVFQRISHFLKCVLLIEYNRVD